MNSIARPFWANGVPARESTRSPLRGSDRCDVAVVGCGLTGLWAAYYLTESNPSLRVAVLEARTVGYGASGRNGGWLSHLVPGNREVYARSAGGVEGVVQLQRALVGCVSDVLHVADRYEIEMDAVLGGNTVVATTQAAMQRLRSQRSADLRYGLTPDEVLELSAARVVDRVHVHGAVGGLHYPTVARIQPMKLVAGLAALVEGRGVRIHESSSVTSVQPGHLTTSDGAQLAAASILLCTEGYSGSLLPARTLIPINSSMLVTQALSAPEWEHIGWAGMECLSDAAHTFIYAQRTSDDRIAIGGRGRPYRYASNSADSVVPAATVAALLHRLRTYYPDVEFRAEQAWSGVLGVTRDWCATVDYDRHRRIGQSIGYAGHGVTAANLGARTLVDLALEQDSPFTALPMVGHRARRWEAEPIRWLGVNAMYRLFRLADAVEERRGAKRSSVLARIGSRLAGLNE